MLYGVHLASAAFKVTMLVLIGNDCIGSIKSNYHTITTRTIRVQYKTSILSYMKYINGRETCMGNQEWTSQRDWHYCVDKIQGEDKQAKSKQHRKANKFARPTPLKREMNPGARKWPSVSASYKTYAMLLIWRFSSRILINLWIEERQKNKQRSTKHYE